MAGSFVVFARIEHLTPPEVLEQPLIFPCAPLSSFPQEYSWSYDDFGTLGAQMHTNPQYPGLSSYTIDTLLPDFDWEQPYTNTSTGLTPLEFCTRLRNLADTMKPFRFQVGNERYWGDWEPLGRHGARAVAVTMRSLRVEERDGEPGDRYVTLSLTEFIDAGQQTALTLSKLGLWHDDSTRVGGSPGRTSGAASSRVRGRFQDIQGRQWVGIEDVTMRRRGRDTLRDISLDYYHTASMRAWQAIVLANGISGISPSDSLADAALAGLIPYKLKIPLLAGSQSAVTTAP